MIALELRIFLAILGGFFLGEGFICWLILWPLARNERLYLRSFYQALMAGKYNEIEEGDENDAD